MKQQIKEFQSKTQIDFQPMTEKPKDFEPDIFKACEDEKHTSVEKTNDNVLKEDLFSFFPFSESDDEDDDDENISHCTKKYRKKNLKKSILKRKLKHKNQTNNNQKEKTNASKMNKNN